MPQINSCVQTTNTVPPDIYTTNLGTQLTYNINFPYLGEADVVVYREQPAGTFTLLTNSGTAGASPPNYTITGSNPSQVTFQAGEAPGGVSLIVGRRTNICSMLVEYQVGASIRAGDLNLDNTQLLYLIQELRSTLGNMINGNDSDPIIPGQGMDLNDLDDVNVGDPVSPNPGVLRWNGTNWVSNLALESGVAWESNNSTFATTAAGDARWLQGGGGSTDLVGGDSITVTVDSPSAGQVTIAVTNSGVGTTVTNDGIDVDSVQIWGQNHDHSGPVTGNMTNVGNITFSAGNRSLTTGATTDDLTIAGGTAAADGALIVNRDLELANAATTQLGGVTYTWPGSDAASANRVLASNGSGSLSWIAMTSGGAGAESVFTAANVAALNALAAQTGDDAMNNGDLVLVVDSTDINDTSVTDPDVTGLPTGDDAPTAWNNTVLTTVQWDGTDSDWNFIRYSSATPDGRYVNESGDTMTGNLLFNDGTANTAINVDGSAVFNENGDSVDFRVESDDNANMLFVDGSEDRVGIGTNSPAGELEVSGGTTRGDLFVTSSVADGLASRIALGNDSGDARLTIGLQGSDDELATIGTEGAFPFNFQTNGSPRMSIDSDGRVGIGTVNPLDGSKLTVASGCLAVTGKNTEHSANSLRIGEEGSGVAQLRAYGPDISTRGSIEFTVSKSDGLDPIKSIIDNQGKLGIGTTSPAHTLDIGNSSSHNTARIIGNSDSTLVITASTTGNARLEFGDSADDDAGKLYYSNSDNAFTFATNGGTEDMRIDSAGRVGIRCNVPTTHLQIGDNTADAENVIKFGKRVDSSNSNLPLIGHTSDGTGSSLGLCATSSSGHILFFTGNDAAGFGNGDNEERMRITNAGNLFVNTQVLLAGTQNTNGGMSYNTGNDQLFISNTVSDNLVCQSRVTSGSANMIAFIYNSGSNGTVAGRITSTASATNYGETSDYRLKKNIVPLAGAVDRLKELKPCRFNFIADPDSTVDGFVAHEAQAVVPESVVGTKDATEAIGILTDWDGTVIQTEVTEPPAEELTYTDEVEVSPYVAPVQATYDEEGNELTAAVDEVAAVYQTVTRTRTWTQTGLRPVHQFIDKSKLVPLLTAALQEAITRIETLEAEVQSLKGGAS